SPPTPVCRPRGEPGRAVPPGRPLLGPGRRAGGNLRRVVVRLGAGHPPAPRLGGGHAPRGGPGPGDPPGPPTPAAPGRGGPALRSAGPRRERPVAGEGERA